MCFPRGLVPFMRCLLVMALYFVRLSKHAVCDTLPQNVAAALCLFRRCHCRLERLLANDVLEQSAAHDGERNGCSQNIISGFGSCHGSLYVLFLVVELLRRFRDDGGHDVVPSCSQIDVVMVGA